MIHYQQLHRLDRSANSSFLVESQLSLRHSKLPEWSTWVMELGTSIAEFSFEWAVSLLDRR